MEKITTASKSQLRLRFIACIYPIAYMLVWPLIYGILPAYSNYYIFGGIYFTLATSMMAWAMYLHRDIKWSVPAYALVGVALFDYIDYWMLHNIFAFIFFLSSTYLMKTDKRFDWLGDISVTWYVLLVIPGGVFWFEAIQAVLISWFHWSYVRRLWRVRTGKEWGVRFELAKSSHEEIMKKIKIEQQDIWDATRPAVHRSKKKYTRKKKHNKDKKVTDE